MLMRLPDETRERSHSSTSIAFVPRKRVSFRRNVGSYVHHPLLR